MPVSRRFKREARREIKRLRAVESRSREAKPGYAEIKAAVKYLNIAYDQGMGAHGNSGSPQFGDKAITALYSARNFMQSHEKKRGAKLSTRNYVNLRRAEEKFKKGQWRAGANIAKGLAVYLDGIARMDS